MSTEEDDSKIIVDALKRLVAKGLATEEIIDGEPHYSLTEAGEAVSKFGLDIAKHSKSKPNTQS